MAMTPLPARLLLCQQLLLEPRLFMLSSSLAQTQPLLQQQQQQQQQRQPAVPAWCSLQQPAVLV
jgi:hypothetical protein